MMNFLKFSKKLFYCTFNNSSNVHSSELLFGISLAKLRIPVLLFNYKMYLIHSFVVKKFYIFFKKINIS